MSNELILALLCGPFFGIYVAFVYEPFFDSIYGSIWLSIALISVSMGALLLKRKKKIRWLFVTMTLWSFWGWYFGIAMWI